MHETVLMRVRQGVGNLACDVDRIVDGQGSARQTSGQRFAFEILHDEIIEISIMADVVHAADVWMVETGDGLGLAIEPLADLGADVSAPGDNLDRDRSIQPHIAGAIHLAHAALAQRLDDFVRTETRARRKDHRPRATRAAASRNS